MNDVVVVGVDGSPDAAAALGWAAALVSVRSEHGPVGVVHAVSVLGAAETLSTAALQIDWAPLRQRHQDELDAIGAATARASGAEVVCHLVEGSPARALADLASAVGATLIVVGVHGGSARRLHMVGSTTHRLLHDSDRPVAVIRAQANSADPSGRLVVGVGDGPATASAIHWAAEFASRESLPIELVRAVNHPPLLAPPFSLESAIVKAAALIDPELLLKWNDDDVRRAAAACSTRGTVSTRVEEGATGPVLVAASKHAKAVVIGKHFDGPLSGYFTTAALHHLLTHAEVPVIVVPADLEPSVTDALPAS
jgi:nucleotide-binding universal stress UspA family protein